MSLRTILLAASLAIPAAGPLAGELKAPVRLEAAGKPIEMESGHAAPFVGDFDGDGVNDLLVGQFGGGPLWIYSNEGTNDAPQLAAGVKLKFRAEDGRVPTAGCIGFGQQLVDLNGDGHMDLISGSWLGEISYFRGGPGRTFAAPEMLKDKRGEFLNIGGGVKERDDGSIVITGCFEFVETPEGRIVKYRGKEYQSTPEKPVSVAGVASAVNATDWDGDGDYDLLVGDIRGNVHLIPNEGTPQDHQFGKERSLEAKGRPIRVEAYAAPFAADWDSDGDLDLLVGSGDGSVSLYRNAGTAEKPKLGSAEELVPRANAPFGVFSKVCAADWNGDGRLDLLVGDQTTRRTDLPGRVVLENRGWVWLFLREPAEFQGER